MYIAVDNQVADSAIDYLKDKGFKVVFRARHEPDHEWFQDAMDLGADIFISPDWDISFLCNRYDVKFIQLEQGLKGVGIGKFIEKRIKEKRFD